jgi:hypothetical protein
MRRFLFNFRKNFKINFDPQHPKIGYLDNVRTSGILLLVSDQELIPPVIVSIYLLGELL